MKISGQSCQSKDTITDETVLEKGVKTHCKQCGASTYPIERLLDPPQRIRPSSAKPMCGLDAAPSGLPWPDSAVAVVCWAAASGGSWIGPRKPQPVSSNTVAAAKATFLKLHCIAACLTLAPPSLPTRVAAHLPARLLPQPHFSVNRTGQRQRGLQATPETALPLCMPARKSIQRPAAS